VRDLAFTKLQSQFNAHAAECMSGVDNGELMRFEPRRKKPTPNAQRAPVQHCCVSFDSILLLRFFD